MGREIKFRAWDGEEMLDGCMMDEMMCNQDLEIDLNVGQFSIRSPYRPGKFTLLQYTGLKDKNSKEIYEGDIVEREVWAFGEPKIFTGEVKEYECAWWIDSGTAAVRLWNEIHELKIIGNIYENPELLGNQDE